MAFSSNRSRLANHADATLRSSGAAVRRKRRGGCYVRPTRLPSCSDFQAILSALLLLERDANGRYPPRLASDSHALPVAEYKRQSGMTAASGQQVDTIVTNSDGNADRRAFLLGRMGPGAAEVVIDPGIDVVVQRLSGPEGLTDQCGQAIQRWYSRV